VSVVEFRWRIEEMRGSRSRKIALWAVNHLLAKGVIRIRDGKLYACRICFLDSPTFQERHPAFEESVPVEYVTENVEACYGAAVERGGIEEHWA
jgi:hypothetical protein